MLDFSNIHHICDIGCGPGTITMELLKIHPHISAVLIDHDKNALNIAQQNVTAMGLQDRIKLVNQNILTNNMAKEYAKRYGAEYSDMDKFIIYFVYGPPIYQNNTRATQNSQIVMGDLPEDICRTVLFRDRYYKLLSNNVVDLFVSAKRFAEKLYGKDLLTRAHATWAQSPTIDQWNVGGLNSNRYKYEPGYATTAAAISSPPPKPVITVASRPSSLITVKSAREK